MYNLYIYSLNIYLYVYIYIYVYMYACMCNFSSSGSRQNSGRFSGPKCIPPSPGTAILRVQEKQSYSVLPVYTLVLVPSSKKHSTRVSTSFTWPSTQGTKTCCKLLSLTFWLLVLWRNAAQRRKVEWRESFKDWWTTWLK